MRECLKIKECRDPQLQNVILLSLQMVATTEQNNGRALQGKGNMQPPQQYHLPTIVFNVMSTPSAQNLLTFVTFSTCSYTWHTIPASLHRRIIKPSRVHFAPALSLTSTPLKRYRRKVYAHRTLKCIFLNFNVERVQGSHTKPWTHDFHYNHHSYHMTSQHEVSIKTSWVCVWAG